MNPPQPPVASHNVDNQEIVGDFAEFDQNQDYPDIPGPADLMSGYYAIQALAGANNVSRGDVNYMSSPFVI
jgi:hypothetical protein